MDLVFIKFFSILIGVLIFCYLVGFCFYNIFKIKPLPGLLFDIFLKLVIGLTIIVVTASAYYTKGKTINVVFLIIGFFVWLINRRSNQEYYPVLPKKEYFKPAFLIFIGSLLIYSLKYIFLMPSLELVSLPHSDYIFYSKISHYVTKFGVENVNMDFVFPYESIVLPYHYYEIWLNSFVSSSFGTSNIYTLLLVTYSIGTIITWVGLCAIFECFDKVKPFYYAFSLSALLFAGVSLLSEDFFIARDANVLTVQILNYYKLFPVYIFLVLSVLFKLKGKTYLSAFSLLCLPVISITTAPSIFLTVFVFYVFIFISEKKERRKSLQMLLGIIVIAFSIICFYIFQNFGLKYSEASPASEYQLLQYLKTFINVLGGTILKLIYIYIPALFVLFVFFLFNREIFIFSMIKREKYLLVFIGLFCFSLLSWAVLHPLSDSVQFFSNLTIPLINIVFISIIFFMITRMKSSQKTMFILGVSGILLINAYKTFAKDVPKIPHSYSYLINVQNQVKNLKPIGAFIKDQKEYNSVFSFKSNFSILGNYLTLFNSEFHPISLSVFDGAIDADGKINQARLDKNSSFYKFVQKQKSKGLFKSYSLSQVDFIKENRIEYLIISKNVALNKHLSSMVKYKVSDSNTGEQFLILEI